MIPVDDLLGSVSRELSRTVCAWHARQLEPDELAARLVAACWVLAGVADSLPVECDDVLAEAVGLEARAARARRDMLESLALLVSADAAARAALERAAVDPSHLPAAARAHERAARIAQWHAQARSAAQHLQLLLAEQRGDHSPT